MGDGKKGENGSWKVEYDGKRNPATEALQFSEKQMKERKQKEKGRKS